MTLLAQPADLETLGEEGLTPDQAQLLLQAATDVVRRYCGWDISQADETLVVDGTGDRLLFLPTLRLTAVKAVRVGGVSASGWSWSSSGIVEASGAWPSGRRNVELDIVHGYNPPPGDVVQVVVAIALRAHLNPAGAASETFAGAATSWAHAGFGPTAVERQVLDRYTIAGQP